MILGDAQPLTCPGRSLLPSVAPAAHPTLLPGDDTHAGLCDIAAEAAVTPGQAPYGAQHPAAWQAARGDKPGCWQSQHLSPSRGRQGVV